MALSLSSLGMCRMNRLQRNRRDAITGQTSGTSQAQRNGKLLFWSILSSHCSISSGPDYLHTTIFQHVSSLDTEADPCHSEIGLCQSEKKNLPLFDLGATGELCVKTTPSLSTQCGLEHGSGDVVSWCFPIEKASKASLLRDFRVSHRQLGCENSQCIIHV